MAAGPALRLEVATRENRHPWTQSIVAWRTVIGVLSFALYVVTLAPTVLWGGDDLARNQVWADTLHLEGGSIGHPLWVLIAHPFTWLPFGDIAYRATLSSAVLSALTLVVVFSVIYDLSASLAGAWLGTAALAVSHTFWTYAVVPKVYALNSLLLAIAVFCALRWAAVPSGRIAGAHHRHAHRAAYLYAIAAALGLGASAHQLFFALAPAFVLYVLVVARRDDIPHILGAAVLYVGLAALSFLPLSPSGEPVAGSDAGTTGLAFIYQFLHVIVSPRSLLLGVGVLVALLVYQFFLTLGALIPGGRAVLRQQPRVLLLLVAIALLDIAFVFAWIPGSPTLFGFANNFHFFLPTFMVAAIVAGVGVANLWPRLVRPTAKVAAAIIVVLVPVVVYAAAPRLARHEFARLGVRSLPGRDNATYLLSPWKQNERGARPYGEGILRALSARGTLLADYSIYWVVRYLHDIEGQRPDVRLVELPPPPALDQHLPLALDEARRGRPLFIPDTNRYYNIAALRTAFRIVPDGPIYRLVRR